MTCRPSVRRERAPRGARQPMNQRPRPSSDKTQRMVGYIGLRKIQEFVREFQEQEAFDRRAAAMITLCCALLVVGGVLLYIGAPTVLEALFRMFS